MSALYFARIGVMAFFAMGFLQSGLDKWLDRAGNLAYFREHFSRSPLAGMVGFLLPALAVLETVTGVVCILAGWRAGLGDPTIGHWAISLCLLTLLSLFAGQRLAKDYAGASTIAGYFAVALLGAVVFSM